MEIESAWPSNPDYVIDLVPLGVAARVWHGDILVAESSQCLRLTETRHVDRLYFPEADVRWEYFTSSSKRSVCPFKGEAQYWTLDAADHREEDVVWTYREPLVEVAGIKGYVSFFQERLRIELIEHWPGSGALATTTTPFPAWGDARDLLHLIDVVPDGPGRFVGPAFGDVSRNVVEGGQLLAQAIIAAGKTIPDQRVTSACMVFSRPATFDAPVAVSLDILHRGRTFSTIAVRVEQDERMRSSALLLLDVGAQDVIRGGIPIPDVGGPEHAVEMSTFRMTGRDLRVVDDAYSGDPDRIGPPELHVWCRFCELPAAPYLHTALMAQSTTHWTIAAALRPFEGFGESMAHSTLSTGVMSIALALHEEIDVTQWLLYSTHAIYQGRGLAQGEGHVFTRGGQLVASYTVQAMIRGFERTPAEMDLDWSTAM